MGRNVELFGKLLNNYNQAAQYARDNAGTLKETAGRVIDVDDPEGLGRVRVVLREVDPKYLEANGLPQGEAKGTESDWINPFPAFKGKQPKSLLEKRVKIMPSQGDPNKMVFGDVLFDKDDDPTIKEMPNTSNMTRLPVYKAGELPPAARENVGCVIVEQGGPQGYDWLMVCLNRGGYKWVRHIDRLHYHDGQLPDTDNDSEGNGPDTSTEQRTYDAVTATTGSPREGSD